jgi:glycosyltransferase involved in cell wall biosynthesis
MSGAVPQRDEFADVPEISIVLPCRNEAVTVALCVEKALGAFERIGVRGEVLVVDNGSTDGSAEIAASAGARVVHETELGYGNALRRGIEEARADWILMADADDSYDLSDLDGFVAGLRGGADLVMGSRFRGSIRPGAMPWLHRWIGNPVLSALLRFLFGGSVSDAHCGMRAFTRDAVDRMDLRGGGMELASEMVVKAMLERMRVAEVPITLHVDGRDRPPHLRTFRDGWRHLRLMLLLSPTHVFVLPGLAIMLLGIVPLLTLADGPRTVGVMSFDVHFLVLGSLLTILGFQIATTGLFAKSYSHAARLYPPDRMLRAFQRHFTLERGLVLGLLLFLVGFVRDAAILIGWLGSGFGGLDAVRPALQASTAMIVGLQAIFSSFFLELLRWAPPAAQPPPSRSPR